MSTERFLRKHIYDPKKAEKIIKASGVLAPVLCLKCRRVFVVELYAKMIIGEDGSEAITEIVSPTHRHPFVCKGCQEGERA